MLNMRMKMLIRNNYLDYSTPWSSPDVYLFTGNPCVNSKGEVVMGRGAALCVKTHYPQVGKLLAQQQQDYIRIVEIQPKQYIGWLQVKYHWASSADLELIKKSFTKLRQLAKLKNAIIFHCNYPGIGCGGLSFNIVQKSLVKIGLPDNVILYK